MRYQGSKVRVAKHIIPLLIEHRKPDQLYVEPFVGGGNVICHIEGGSRLGIDANPYIVALLRALASGWHPPEHISEERYQDVKHNPDTYQPELVGFCGTQASYGSAWFGGYARGYSSSGAARDFPNEGYRACIAQSSGLRGCEFVHSDYRDVRYGKKPAIIYCDPPYAGVTGYRGSQANFDSKTFWQWCAERSDEGHRVYVSEYAAPEGWREIWSREVEGFRSQTPTGCKVKRPTEKLFERDV